MPRAATGVAGIVSRAAASPPGQAGLAALALTRLRLAVRRGQAADGAVEVARRARFLADRDAGARARGLLRRAARVLRGRRAQSVVAVEDAVLALDSGHVQPVPVRALTGLLAEADAACEAHDDALAEELLDMALRLLFHPRLHFSAAPSALAADPAGFLAPLHASAAWAALTAPRCAATSTGGTTARAGGGVGPGPADAPGSGSTAGSVDAVGPGRDLAAATAADSGLVRTGYEAGLPRRLLVISLKNWTFVRDIVKDYEADPRCEVRTLDLLDLPVTPSRRSLLHARLVLARGGDPATAPGLGHGLPEDVVDTLAWADTVLVEWGSAAAVWASLLLPVLAPHARLLVRIHSYEASTAMPQLVDWTGVDGLVTVSPAIREILRASLDLPDTLTVTTVPNRALLTRFHQPKTEDSSRTLALVGWAALRKDPAWALDVLDLLRAQDPAWRLLLIGPDFPAALPADERAYAEEVTARIAALGDAVTVTGRTEEVPEHLRHAAVILSSSRREGTHEGFIEGAASGALPVVRNWPDVARWGGPAALFPDDWVVESPEEAADRIRSLADDPAYRQAQATWMIEHADWSRVRPLYDALLLT